MRNQPKNSLLWWILPAGLLAGEYWICRFVFFSWHGMKQWPAVLALASLLFLGVAFWARCRIAAVFTVACYLAGFFLGILFGTGGTDPGGGRTNSGWLIWTAGLLVGSLAGFAIGRIRKKHMQKNSAQ